MKNKFAAFILVFCVTALLWFSAAADSGSAVLPGTMFRFGSFEQDNNYADGAEPILWRVLDTDDYNGLVLAVSEYGLYTMKYHRNNSQTAWVDCDVRDWLNSAFLSSFTDAEMQQIAVSWTNGSADYFFLLDSDQITRYLFPPYLCYATAYALEHGEKGAYVNKDTGASSWLVRTDTATNRIAWVGGGGVLYSPTGNKGVNYLNTADNVVRPAMWIRSDAVYGTAGNTGRGLYARTKMAISTRSGPSTGYNGLGDYFSDLDIGHSVHVISRAHDGSIWWLEIEFEYNGVMVRCYTGLKRIDIDISLVPDDTASFLGYGQVVHPTEAWYGPGTGYKRMPDRLTPAPGTWGNVVKEENGWYCLEYPDADQTVRVWLPSDVLLIN